MTAQSARISTDMVEFDRLFDVNGLHVIDAGCGGMRFTNELAERGARVLAIDPDPVQAEKNRQARLKPGVQFAEAGAETLPVESTSVDGILFSYSLHHVPAELYPQVFSEAKRVLKPGGFLCAMEPVAEGELNEITSLFHDEKHVRAEAQLALNTFGAEHLDRDAVVEYYKVVEYKDWNTFADYFSQKSFNTGYTDKDVRRDEVKRLFERHAKRLNSQFLSPMKITCLRKPV